MSTAARIDELRRKFEENPRRYFAPLANEYRKAGELGQAIALCREHLPKQPGHMSGYIVFGQALYESGALVEARTVFEQALALDPENLIALRHLGDIAKASGDALVARRWYERVLDADPRNDDIAAQLASLASIHTASRPTPQSVTLAVPPLPSEPVPSFGLGTMPTPDATLRAVDFDVVNKRLSRYTPLDLDAIETAGHVQPLEARPNDAPDRVDTHSPSVRSIETDEGQPDAHHDSSAAVAQAQSAAADFVSSSMVDETRQALHAELPEHVHGELPPHAAEHAAEPALEDELALDAHTTSHALHDDLTPVPEPSVEPRVESHPHDASRSVHDALGAFALHDPTDELQSDHYAAEPIETELPSSMRDVSQDTSRDEVHGAALDVATTGDAASIDDAFEEGIVAPEWPVAADLIAQVSTPRFFIPHVIHPTPDAIAAFGREPHEPAEHSVDMYGSADDGAAEHAAQPQALVEADLDDHLLLHAEPADTAEAPRLDDEESPVYEAAAHDTSLPWLSEPDEIGFNADPDRAADEIAAMFESDARASGDDSAVTVASLDTFHPHAAPIPAEASFADVVASSNDADDDSARDEEVDQQASSSAPAFVTETMAELLVAQGFIARAVGVYEELVVRHPYDPVISSRLDELRAKLDAETSMVTRQGEEQVASFSDADQFESHEEPASAFPTPAYLTPIFTPPVSLTPAHALNTFSTPSGSMPVFAAHVLTARERVARLAGRRVSRRTPAVATPVVHETSDGLATLFGGGSHVATDDTAARAFADAFAPMPASSSNSSAFLDFEAGEAAPMPTLREVRAPTPLSVDALRTTPASGGANAGFSFDRFFPDPATRSASTPPTSTTSAGEPAATPDPATPLGDDLAQFSAWLKGLGTT